MSFGLEVKDAAGGVVLSVSDRITRFITTITVSSLGPGASTAVNVSGIQNDGTWLIVARNIQSYRCSVTISSGQVTIQNLEPYATLTNLSFAVFRY